MTRNPSHWRDYLRENGVALDGGFATALEARGHDLSGHLWSAALLVTQPDEVIAVHRDHGLAGAQVLTSASYQVSRSGFASAGMSDDAADAALLLSVALARKAAEEVTAATGRECLVAASVGPYGATLADGSEYRGDYAISPSDLKKFHRERLEILSAAQPDFLAFETVPSVMELSVINDLLTSEFSDLPAWVSASANSASTISDGTDVADAFAGLTADCIIAFGFNCTDPKFIRPLLDNLRDVRPELARIAYSNAGQVWDAANRQWLSDGQTALDADIITGWTEAGCRMIGGCCGLGTDHISMVGEVLAKADFR